MKNLTADATLSVMSAARIAAITAIACFAMLAAAQTPESHMTVTVVDVSGAVIGSAKVIVHNSSGSLVAASTTNNLGAATVNLPPDSHTLSVLIPGFKSWQQDVNLQRDSGRAIKVRLEISSLPPCTLPCGGFERRSDPDTEIIPIDAVLPYKPLDSIDLARTAKHLPHRHLHLL